jgi:hypothetical protein
MISVQGCLVKGALRNNSKGMRFTIESHRMPFGQSLSCTKNGTPAQRQLSMLARATKVSVYSGDTGFGAIASGLFPRRQAPITSVVLAAHAAAHHQNRRAAANAVPGLFIADCIGLKRNR